MEGGTGFIDNEEFVDAMFRLYQTLNSKEKDDLLNFDRARAVDPHKKVCTFKPQISKNQAKRSKLASYLKPLATLKNSDNESYLDSQNKGSINYTRSI